MSTLTRYLNRVVLVRLAIVLVAIVGFALVLDMIDVGSRIIRRSADGHWGLLRYALLRTPTLLTQMLPMASLLAGLLAVAELIRSRELIVIWNLGVTRIEVLLRLWPIALLLVGMKFAIDDRVLPRVVPELRDLRVGEFKPVGLPEDGAFWLQEGDDVIRLPSHAAADGRLEDILIVRRDAQGIAEEQIWAARAVPRDGMWRLENVVRRPASTAPPERLAELDWPIEVELGELKLMAKIPRELTLVELARIIRHDGFGMGLRDSHVVSLNARLATPLMPILMLALGIAAARRFDRRNLLASLFVRTLLTGFLASVVGNMLLAFGEVGLAPVWLAVWATPAGLLLVVLALAGIFERRSGRRASPVAARPIGAEVSAAE